MKQINMNDFQNDKLKIPSFSELKELIFVKYKRITIMGCIAFVIMVAMAFAFNKYISSENEACEKYSKYVNSLYATDNTVSQETPKQVILPSKNTVDMNKINSDLKTSEALLQKLFTFNDGATYDENRNTLIKMFGEDSDVVKSVFTVNDKVEVDGKEYNYVDLHEANMEVTDIKTYPIEINNDGNNRYMSLVSFSSHTNDDNEISYMLSVMYDVDEYGSMVECNVYLLDNNY